MSILERKYMAGRWGLINAMGKGKKGTWELLAVDN